MSVKADVVVIGAGFAGAATAYHLVRAGIRDVLILEQEALPGSHASGLNAGMAWQAFVPEPVLSLSIEGTRFIRQGFDDAEPVDFLHCGSIVLGVGDDSSELRGRVVRLRSAGLSASWLEASDVWERAPHARGPTCEGGLYCGDDGVVDIAALLRGFIRVATAGGARLATDRQVTAMRRRPGQLWAVETRAESVETPTIVNAAGAWAGEIGRLAGASSPPLSPCRRHLAVSGPLPWVERGWPIVWDVSNGLYFRPEPPGLLLSACDATPHRPARGPVPTDPAILETLASKRGPYPPTRRSWRRSPPSSRATRPEWRSSRSPVTGPACGRSRPTSCS